MASQNTLSKGKEQELLLQIVETWRLSEFPQYRGFRCANCQQYRNEAWYHWLNSGYYRLPVHMCKDTCEPAFQNGTILIDQAKRQQVNGSTFGNSFHFGELTLKRFNETVGSWPK